MSKTPPPRKPRKKRGPLPDDHRRKLSEAMKGNTNAVGHKINPASIAALEGRRGPRPGNTNPKSLKNLVQFRVRKKRSPKRAYP